MTGVYNPKKVIATIGTIPERLTGFAKGSSIKAEYSADRTSEEAGLDGEVVVSVNPSNLGIFTFNLQAGSASNKMLQRKHAALKAGRYDEAFFPVSVEDLTQGRLASATKCWVKVAPPLDAAEEAGSNEWKLGAADMNIEHNGTDGV
jgi:hypothetical protein